MLGRLVQPGDRAEQVHLERLAVLMQAVLCLPHGRHDACCIDDQVEAAEFAHDPREERRNVCGEGDVVDVGPGEGVRVGRGGPPVDRVGDVGELQLASSEECQPAARFSEASREGSADAGGGAHDDRPLPGWS